VNDLVSQDLYFAGENAIADSPVVCWSTPSGTVRIADRAETAPLGPDVPCVGGVVYRTSTRPGSHAISRTTCESLTPGNDAASAAGM